MSQQERPVAKSAIEGAKPCNAIAATLHAALSKDDSQMFNSKKALNAVLAVGYGVYLTLNCSKEQKEAIKAENAQRRQQQAVQPQQEVTEQQTEVVTEVIEIAEIVTVTTVEDIWEAPLQATKKPQWTTAGQIHTITPQLLLAPAMEVAEQLPIVDYSSWSVKALKAEAQKRNIKAYYNLRKAQLIERLTA